jgi:hypothetical protein
LSQEQVSWFGSIPWANSQLSFAIGQLKETSGKSSFVWKNTLVLVLVIKERLLEFGFQWQASMLEHWIHRYSESRNRGAPKGRLRC